MSDELNPGEDKKTVEITVKELAQVTDFMEKSKALGERVEKVEKGLISKEQFLGEATELYKGMMAEHEKAFAHAEERRIKFAGATVNGDRAVTALKAAMEPARPWKERSMLFEGAATIPSAEGEVKALQELNDDCMIIDTIMRHGTFKNQYEAAGGMKSLNSFGRYQDQLQNVTKAIAPMDTADTASFIPTALSAQVLELPWLVGKIEALFEHLPMPTSPYKVPLDLTPSSTMADLIAEATTNTNNPGDTYGQAITDSLQTFTAAKLRSRMITSAELDEDAIMLWMPRIKKRLTEIMANTVEACDLNGDTTATHQDTDIEALGANDGRTAWKGLRKLFLAGSLTKDCTSGDLNEANLHAIRALLGIYGVDPTECAWIFGPTAYIKQIILLTNVRTVDKYGPAATVIKGELAKYDGAPIVVSAHQREDLNASGVDDGVTATKGCCMYVNKNYFFHGDRRLVTLDGEKWITTDQFNLVCFRRLDFQPLVAPSTTYSFGAMGYNFTP